MKKIYSFFLLLFLVLPLNAQWQQITSTNISGVIDYESIIYTGSTILIANEAGVYRSDDNGIKWVLSVDGLDTTNLSVNDIVYIQSRNEVWLASNGNVFKSTDKGKSWKKEIISGLPSTGWGSINQIGRIKNRLIISYSYYDSGLSKNVTRLFFSDDGVVWSEGAKIYEDNGWHEFIHSFNDKFLGIVYDPQNGSGRVLRYSEDGSVIDDFPLTGLGTNVEIEQENFSVDLSGDWFFYRHRKVKKIYRYNFTTKEWEEKMKGIEFNPYNLIELFSAHSLGGYAFASAIFDDGGSQVFIKLFYSSNNGDTWSLVSNPGVDFPVFEKEMIFAGGNRLVGSYFNKLIAYSDNLGQTWTPITDVSAGRYNDLVSLDDGSIFTVSPDQMKGLVKTTDNGNTWTIFNGDLPGFLGLHFINSIFPGGLDIMYLIGQEDPFDETQVLFKTTDYGDHWTKVTIPPNKTVIHFVGFHGMNTSTGERYPILYFGDDSGTGIYAYSNDGGNTWNTITGIAALGVERVLGIKGNGSLMILFAEKPKYKVRVYKSTNNGSTFTDITSNLDVPNLDIMIADMWAWDRHPSPAASFNLGGTSFITAVMDWNTWPNRINFYQLNTTQDGWNKIGDGIEVPYKIDVNSLKHDGKTWYFVTPAGVYVSADNCQNWSRFWNNEGFVMGLRPRCFMVNNYGVFMGTEEGGLWRAPITLPVLSTVPVTEITETTAKSGGTISSTGGLPCMGKGLVYSTSPNPEIGTGNALGCGYSWENYTCSLFSLTPNTTYYVKAFATNPKGHGYGNQVSFTTLNPTGIVIHKQGEVYLYPNPSNGLFNIVADADMVMTVMNVIGKVVMTAPVYGGINTYELKNQPAGIYFVKLKGENNQEQTIRLIIK